MADAPIRIVAPLESEEIKLGIATLMHFSVPGLPIDLIIASLNKTCSLNRQSFAKIKATWWVDCDYENVAYQWWVDYELDDFGRIESGGIGGSLGIPIASTRIEGIITTMPPDKFRRETAQPIPKALIIAPKKDNGLGMTKTHRGRVKGKDA